MISQDSKKIIEGVLSDLTSMKLRSCGIAVSGGSDSMALLHILTDWQSPTKPKLSVASIDHGLRSDSKSEVEFVKKVCEEKKVEHFSLAPTTQLLETKGNLQDNARSVRYQLLKNWAYSKNIQCILIGHTLDDQEETILMRFLRGSGVDGLVSMEKKVQRNEILWIRPLLKLRKEVLRDYLRSKNYSWIEDPSNYDDKYQRVKVRELLQHLKHSNLIAPNFVKTAEHMLRASQLLKETAISASKNILSFNEVGQITFEVEKYSELFEDTQYRILAGIISWFSGNFYKPRFSQLQCLYNKIIKIKNLTATTLGGTVFRKKNGIVTVTRELAAIKKSHEIQNEKFIWDNRWLITLKFGIIVKSYVEPYGLSSFDQHNFYISGDFDKRALGTIPAITINNAVKFVPFSNFEYDVDVKLLNQDQEFYKFF